VRAEQLLVAAVIGHVGHSIYRPDYE
jgi:hypothetical protein